MSTNDELALYLTSMFTAGVLQQPAHGGVASVPADRSLVCLFAEPRYPAERFIAALFLLGLIRRLSSGRLRTRMLLAARQYLGLTVLAPGLSESA